MTIIAQISDLHLTASGELYEGVVDTFAYARAAIETLNKLEPRPDALVVTGDVSDGGDPSEYEVARSLFSDLAMPVFPCPGNHDHRENFRFAFRDLEFIPQNGPLHYVAQIADVTLIHLDCTVPGKHHGDLDPYGLVWLRKALAASQQHPTLVAMHHHPFDSGVGKLDVYKNNACDQIQEVLSDFDHVQRIIFGHVHRLMTAYYGGTIAISCPSTSAQIQFRLSERHTPKSVMEPPGLLIHNIQSSQTVSHLLPIGDFGNAMNFF